ncbi:MAG: hypothetical protein PHC48_05335 [Prevotella sp.]|nr:hypothetical protein [Prevotella sp.]MDT3387796.1 hypothetical protein [Bacteroidota bacterium]
MANLNSFEAIHNPPPYSFSSGKFSGKLSGMGVFLFQKVKKIAETLYQKRDSANSKKNKKNRELPKKFPKR